jgi:hypothetical protein
MFEIYIYICAKQIFGVLYESHQILIDSPRPVAIFGSSPRGRVHGPEAPKRRAGEQSSAWASSQTSPEPRSKNGLCSIHPRRSARNSLSIPARPIAELGEFHVKMLTPEIAGNMGFGVIV